MELQGRGSTLMPGCSQDHPDLEKKIIIYKFKKIYDFFYFKKIWYLPKFF